MKKIIECFLLIILSAVFIYVGRPKLAAFFYNQGSNYYRRGLYNEAIVYYKKSLKINYSIAVAHYMLASAYMKNNRQAEALESYKTAIEIDPNFVEAYRGLVYIYQTNQMYEEAINRLKQAELKVSANQEIKNLLKQVSFEYMADCLDKGTDAFLAGDRQKAQPLLIKAAEARPDFAFARYALAYFYYTGHDYDEAERELNSVVRLDPQFYFAYKLLGDIYFEKGIYREAAIKYEIAASLNPNDAIIQNDLGLSLMKTERYGEAIIHLEQALSLDPQNLNIRYSLASTYRDKGNLDEALLRYKKIDNEHPDYPNLHNDLGDIYIHQGKKKEALEEYSREIGYSRQKILAKPNDAVILNNLAYALNGSGSYSEAKAVIEKALSLEPNYRQAQLTLAKIYESLGKADESVAILTKAKALSEPLDFIDRDIDRVKKARLNLLADKPFSSPDIVYLKTGRQFKGMIKGEDEEKVILEVKVGNSAGNLTFYRADIERVVKSGEAE